MALQHSVLAVTLHQACVAAKVLSPSLFPQLPHLAPLAEPSTADFFGLERNSFPQPLERVREVTAEDFDARIRLGRPFIIADAGRGIDLVGAGCQHFHEHFPSAQMRAEYTGDDRPEKFVSLGSQAWFSKDRHQAAKRKKSSKAAHAKHSTAPYVWHVKPMDQQITAEGPRIAIFNVAMIGHVNPTFALVQELCKRGCKVSYFLPPVASIRAAAVESGAVVEGYLPEDPSDFVMEKCGIDEPLCHAVPEILEDDRAEYERAVWPLAQALLCGEYVIERCRHLGVSVVLYDPFLPLGLLAATKLGIQCASLVTYPGMGSLSGLMSTLEAEGRLERAGAIRKPYGNAIQDKFGVDLSCNLLTRRQFYAKTNFVTTCEDLIAELPALGEQNWADELRKEFSFCAVGCLVSSSAPHVITARSDSFIPRVKSFGHSLPVAELSDQLAKGRKIIYAALGTMALSDRWSIDLGRISGYNLPHGTTGKAFCQHVWKALLAAMEELGDDFFCLLSVGKQPDALDFLGSSEAEIFEHVPSNLLIRGFVPQVDMLNNYTSAFISHAGFNSLQESLMAGVPLVAIPQAVDQPANARKVEQRGWGQAFFKPMETVSSTALAEALRQVCDENSTHRQAVQSARSELAGGAPRLAERLLSMSYQSSAALGGC
eukprot:s3044_g3.t3